MAHNVIKKYETEADFHANIRDVLNQWYNNSYRLQRLSSHLSDAAAGDYPNSPLTDLNTLRTNLESMLSSTEYTTFKAKTEDFLRI